LHVREGRVGGGGAVRVDHGGHGLVAAVDLLDERRGLGVLLDVHDRVPDALGVELRAQPAAVPAPDGRVHQHGACGGYGRGRLGHRSSFWSCQWFLRESQTMLTQTNSVGPDAPGPRTPDAILSALDPEQREVALALTGPVVVLAGAGTGKTRAITHRIAYGVRVGAYKPTSLLAVTFTARAAGEMRTRLRGLGVQGVQARTFHAAALRQLSYFWPRVVGGAPPRLQEHKAQLVAEAARRLGLSVDRVAVRDLSSEV